MEKIEYSPSDIGECQCPQSGFCEFFRQEMTYDPPNWQWCQNATPEERMKYKADCDKKHDRRSFIFTGRFVTIDNMMDAIKHGLLPKVGDLNLRGVAGVPRSGVFPASIVAMWLNIPLYVFDEEGKFSPLSAMSDFGGVRMQHHRERDGAILVLDDTVYGGVSMQNIKKRIGDNNKVLYGSVYVHTKSSHVVDVFGEILDPPHILEWNFFNSSYIENSLIDFDGILSPNVPYEKCQREEDYIDYITNVKPLYHRLHRTYKCKGIVTARLEKYRDITEAWLDKYNIEYGSLTMFPTEREEERDANHILEAAKFKAEVIRKLNSAYFVESEIAEAHLIRKNISRVVICPDEGRFG